MQGSGERLTEQNLAALTWLAEAFAFSIAEEKPNLRPYLSAVADEVIFEFGHAPTTSADGAAPGPDPGAAGL